MNAIRLTPELCELDTLNEFVLNEIPIKNIYINLFLKRYLLTLSNTQKQNILLLI